MWLHSGPASQLEALTDNHVSSLVSIEQHVVNPPKQRQRIHDGDGVPTVARQNRPPTQARQTRSNPEECAISGPIKPVAGVSTARRRTLQQTPNLRQPHPSLKIQRYAEGISGSKMHPRDHAAYRLHDRPLALSDFEFRPCTHSDEIHDKLPFRRRTPGNQRQLHAESGRFQYVAGCRLELK